MTEDKALTEFELLRRHLDSVRAEMCLLLKSRPICMMAFTQLIRSKPTLANAEQILNRAKASAEVGHVQAGVASFFEAEIALNNEYRATLHDYRLKLDLFQGLLDCCRQEKQPELEKLKTAWKEWRTIRRLMVRSSFFDLELTREFVALDCLFEILNYYYGRRPGVEYKEVKGRICRLISEWNVEDLLAKNKLAEEVLENFLRLGGSHRTEKEQISMADLDTNHSSNQKLIKSLAEVETEICIGKRSSCDVIYFDLDETSPTAQERVSKSTKDSITILRPILYSGKSSNHTNLLKPSLSILPTTAKTNREVNIIDLEAPEDTELLDSVTANKYDQARSHGRRLLAAAIRKHCHTRLAIFYACNLELDIFSKYYSCLESYTSEISRIAGFLVSLLAREGLGASIKTTAFDMESILRLASRAGKAKKPQDFKLFSETDLNNDRSESSPSILDMDPRCLRRIRREPNVSGLAIKQTGAAMMEEDPFDFLHTVTRLKEQETVKLKQLIMKLEDDNRQMQGVLESSLNHLRQANNLRS